MEEALKIYHDDFSTPISFSPKFHPEEGVWLIRECGLYAGEYGNTLADCSSHLFLLVWIHNVAVECLYHEQCLAQCARPFPQDLIRLQGDDGA